MDSALFAKAAVLIPNIQKVHGYRTTAPYKLQKRQKAAEFLEDETLRLYLDFLVLRIPQMKGLVRRKGRSALRPGDMPRACRVDGPPPSSPKPRRI